MMINILHLVWILPVTGAIAFSIALLLAAGKNN